MEMQHYLAHTVAMWSLVKCYMIARPSDNDTSLDHDE